MLFHSIQFKRFLLILTCIVSLVLIGRNINPFSDTMFRGHDETQAARIQQYSLNLSEGQIPPRIAPDFSYKMGYPVFTYYAPFAYLVTSLIHLSGIDILVSIKLSYLIALTVGFVGMFFLLKRFFPFYPGLLGAVAYISSPYIATEIFVRANLAEMWFFALFPLSLYLLLSIDKKKFVVSCFIFSFLFTSHNIFSLFSFIFLSIFIFFTENRKMNYIAIFCGLLLSAYFYLPLFSEMNEVQASFIATLTDFQDHFLCAKQIWTSLIGFAGSAKGCELDGMSFMLGKLHIIFAGVGLVYFGYQILRKRVQNKVLTYCILFALTLIFSLVLTLEQSRTIWEFFSKFASLVQFPWRLLLLSVFGSAFFTAYIGSSLKKEFQYTLLGVVAVFLIFNMKFFYGQTLSKNQFEQGYLSEQYITREVAYRVPEFLPTHVDYQLWKQYEKNENFLQEYSFINIQKGTDILEVETKPFSRLSMVKSVTPLTLNILYMPYWQIKLNNINVTPSKFDSLGRPIMTVSKKDYDSLEASYEQTPIELVGNLLSLGTAFMLSVYLLRTLVPSWKHLNIHIKKI